MKFLLRYLLVFLLAIFINVVRPANIQKTEKSITISSPFSAAEAAASSSQGIVIGNKDTKRYHLQGMPFYNKVKKYHRVYFDSEQQAIENGYYKAGTGKDLTGRASESGEKIKKQVALATAASAVTEKSAQEALQKNANASEIKTQDAPKTVEKTLSARGETIKDQTTPAAAASTVTEKSAQEALQKNANILETKVQDTPKPVEEPLKLSGENIQEKTVKKETVVDALTKPLSNVTGAMNTVFQNKKDLPVKIEADNIAYDNERDVYTAKGNVVITYDDGVLTAANVEFDQKNNLATAQGGAFLKMAQDTLQGDKIVVNVEDKSGVAYNSKAFYARNHFYIKGDKIEKTGENTYYIEKPRATTCDGDNPDWQLAGSEMKVTIDGYGWVKHARLLTAGLPVIYSPFVAFPAKTTRQTGFLFPYLAYSRSRDGLDVEVPFFWAINPQMDATFYPNYIEKRGFKLGAEFRYFAGSKSFGTLYGDYMEDNKHVSDVFQNVFLNVVMNTQTRDWQEMHRRWSYYVNHQTNFDPQFYFRTDLRGVSDSWYFRDFYSHNYFLTHYAATEEDPFRKIPFLANESLPSLESSVRLYKGWNNYNLMARISSTDDFSANNNERTLQKYPEIIFTVIKQPLFSTPVYLEFAGNYDYFYRHEGQRGHYIDFAPMLSLPFNISKYAKVTPQILLRETYWKRDDDEANSQNKTGNRTIFNAGLSVSSQLSRVYDTNIQNWEKVRHEIKPEIFYSYIPNVRQDNIPDYFPLAGTFLDPFMSLKLTDLSNVLKEQNAVAWSLTNTMIAKMKNQTGTNTYLEILRFKLFQMYDINEANKDMAVSTTARRPLLDLGVELDLRPHPYFSFAARNKYNVYDGWREMNYDLGLHDWRGDTLTFGYRYTRDYLEEINMDLRAVITDRLSGKFILRRDQFNGRTVENTVGLTYTKQCWSVGVDYMRTYDDERIMMKVSLTGLFMLSI